MAKMKTKTIYSCQNCGAQFPKWQGKCSECNQWNTVVEETSKAQGIDVRGWAIGLDKQRKKSVSLNCEIQAEMLERYPTSYKELDRVLGGGVVPGSFILLGGDPGIGKSTLLMQVAGGLSKAKRKTLYVSSEESISQTAMRAQRLGVKSELVEVASENNLQTILDLANEVKPDILVIDSIQTVYMPEIQSAPGSVSQVRECAGSLMMLAKAKNICIVLIGHVTKDGSIAGPKVLEHMVDTVLSFEGDTNYQFRLVRSLKNRFGPANQLGVFQMFGSGLQEVDNPSELFLENREGDAIGATVFACIEGQRPFLCEIQSLVTYTPLNIPRRTTIGLPNNRIHLLTAVIEKYMNVNLSNHDVYVNIVGGLKIEEPASDLAILAAMVSSEGNQVLPSKACFFGEIGLTGEVRAVPFADIRLQEAIKLGYYHFFIPQSNQKHVSEFIKNDSIKFQYVSHVRDLKTMFGKRVNKTTPQEKSIEI
jgi:DNA repair protein RadA/Sms